MSDMKQVLRKLSELSALLAEEIDHMTFIGDVGALEELAKHLGEFADAVQMGQMNKWESA